MAIEITQGEMWGFNGLNTLINNSKAEMQAALGARQAYVELLETKYNAVFDPTTGKLKPKEEATQNEGEGG